MDNQFNNQQNYQQDGPGQPGGQYQNNYQPNNYQPNNYQRDELTEPMSFGQWLLTIIVAYIPCVGLIMYLIWAFGSNVNVNRKNYCRANLVVTLISLVLGILLLSVIGMSLFAAFEELYYYY